MNLAQFLLISSAHNPAHSPYLHDLRIALLDNDLDQITSNRRATERLRKILWQTQETAVKVLGEEDPLVQDLTQVLEVLDAASIVLHHSTVE